MGCLTYLIHRLKFDNNYLNMFVDIVEFHKKIIDVFNNIDNYSRFRTNEIFMFAMILIILHKRNCFIDLMDHTNHYQNFVFDIILKMTNYIGSQNRQISNFYYQILQYNVQVVKASLF